jgi:hypothetical protein
LLIKNGGKNGAAEILVNRKMHSQPAIVQVHIAKLFAGIPWIETRVKTHIVNEVAQTLYKVLVFTNPANNPLQKWKQGRWFAIWEGEPEGDYTCTLYVSVYVQENKIKPQKGQNHGWQ